MIFRNESGGYFKIFLQKSFFRIYLATKKEHKFNKKAPFFVFGLRSKKMKSALHSKRLDHFSFEPVKMLFLTSDIPTFYTLLLALMLVSYLEKHNKYILRMTG